MMKHPFVCVDSGLGKVMKFDEDAQLVWDCAVPCSFDVWMLPDGNVLCSTMRNAKGNGVIALSPDKRRVFEFYTSGEVFGCQPLPNGNVLVGELEPCRLIELDRQGQMQFELPLRCVKGGHGAMRMPRKLRNGNFLVCHMGDQMVREYSPIGNVIREIKSPGPVFVAIRLPNGNTLLSSEEAILEVDVDDNVVWTLADSDIPEVGIRLLTGLQRLPNGNTVVCNWLGHGKEGQGAPLFEVTRDKKVVWKFTDVKTTRNVGNFQLLDVPGDPLLGDILR